MLVVASLLNAATLRGQVTVTGTVMDSVSHRRLSGALVQLAPDSGSGLKSATTDSLGAFRIDSVRPGSYIIGFFHPALDSLGFELSPRRLVVTGGGEQHVELATPSASSVVDPLCRATPNRDSTGLLLGHIRDADTKMPRAGTVTLLWMELVIGQGGVRQNRQQIPAKSDAMGWFALCGIPSNIVVSASAESNDEESGTVSLQVPARGLLVRDFLVSRADSTIPVYEDSSPAAGRVPIATLRRGNARLSGVVRTDKGRPVPNAEVSVPGTGLDARTQERGEFALTGLPSGTQSVEVRAIGFEPKDVPVDLARGSLTTVDVGLDRPVQTLDAVKIYGKGNTTLAEFQRRLRAGWGHFLTPVDIANRHAFRATDLFRTMAGVRVAPTRRGNAVLLRGGCLPTVYLNGARMADDAARDIDTLAPAEEVTAVEVYTAAERPPEFWGNNCGTVVLWVGMLPR